MRRGSSLCLAKGALARLLILSFVCSTAQQHLQKLCSDARLERLQAELWQVYEVCQAKDVRAPFKSCLPYRVSDPLAVLSQDIVESILHALDAQQVHASELRYQCSDCLEGLINALAVFARPLLHTSRGQLAAAVCFNLASAGCWPLLGQGKTSWPVTLQDILNLELSAEAWRDHGDEAEFLLPPRKPMPPALLNRLTLAKLAGEKLPQALRIPTKLNVLSTGHHASYPVAISAMWRALLPEYDIRIEDHSFDDRYCRLYGTCSADSRFAWLGDHLRGTLVRTCSGHYLKGFENIESLAEQLFELVSKDPLASRTDVLLCTHPPYSCRLFLPFVQRLGLPLLGFFGGTLEAHVPEDGIEAWLKDFRSMAEDPRVQFAAIAPFLAEKMRYQSGVDIPASRGFGFHIIEQGGSYFPRRWDDVLVWKGSSECDENQESFDNAMNELSRSLSRGSDLDVLLRFVHLHTLRKSAEGASYSSITSFRAVVFVPYEVLLMTFYELYHAAIPIFIPVKELGVFFMYRGPVTYPHCDFVLADGDGEGEENHAARKMHPYSPFDRMNVTARLSWLEAYTDWYQWPHNQQYSSLPDLMQQLYTANLQAVSAAMRSETSRAMAGASAFWQAAFKKVLGASQSTS